jgi:hypothetical protein
LTQGAYQTIHKNHGPYPSHSDTIPLVTGI